MKLPIIRQLYQTVEPGKLEAAAEVLESFSDFRGVSDEELNVAGELMTNIFGAIEVHRLVKEGKKESEALNAFAQKVLGAIDK
ncbi:DUF6952 family protein [Haoranjiania flava]|uniref:Uncharacterized protein n=1 Tax=Haoranjiania flava TaxID=1856322 RepID=A0AAE3IMY2_9BACT|nr:hypothetical protein [Haoranjiania flava]MCU7694564.1 hypothetical protein [Haoranjiania flava]